MTGYGIWYERKPHTYSNAEFMAPQGHNNSFNTADCTPPDRDERKLGDDDSLLESDWEKHTSVVLKVYWECKKDECRINDSKRSSREGSGCNGRKRGK